MADLPKQQSFVNTVIAAIKIARPLHWSKNLSLYAALLFTGTLFIPSYFITVTWAFIAFNFASSAAYVFNDVFDAKSDKLHPIKRKRPIPSEKISPRLALLEAVTLVFIAFYLASYLNTAFFFLLALYAVLQLFYTLGLKKLYIIDILIIAAGFIIRVYAGALVINAHLSVWFLLCVVSVALFLAAGKRRAELNIAERGSTRKSLSKYKTDLLNSYVTMFGSAAWMSWALFTFFESPKASPNVWLFLAEISKATTINKLLMVTIPIVIFGIMRYQSLIFEEKTEAPEKLLLTDIPLMLSAILWAVSVTWILYGGVSI
ncbi:UbiA prenyltransferase family protein [Patescibacteria group bacterium]